MILRIVLCGIVLACTYGMVQLEMQYYDAPIDFYLNMLTHFLGGLASGLGVLIGGNILNKIFPGFIPPLPLWAMVFVVLTIGLVWEAFEVVYKANIFMTEDTLKDLCMDTCGAVGAYFIGSVTNS